MMKNIKVPTLGSDNMSFLERGIRVSLGLAILLGTMQASITGGDAYPIIKLFATIVVLTGITGWDPLYAISRKIMSRMTNIEMVSFSTGNISMPDRALRIGLGLAILMASIQTPIGGPEAFPFIKLFATIVVLTGIAGWDPLYSAFRKASSKLWNIRLEKSLSSSPTS